MKVFEELYQFVTTVKIYILFQQELGSSTPTKTFLTSKTLQPARLVTLRWSPSHPSKLMRNEPAT